MKKVFKKYGIVIVSVFFVLVLVLTSVIFVVSTNKYKNAIASRDMQINELSSFLQNIGELQTGYVVTQSVRAGEEITEELIQEVDVPTKLGLNLASSKEEVVGNYFRISLSEGTVLTMEDVLKEELNHSERYIDVVLDETPLGIEVGDYIDIRILFPYGEDFIGISHKKVEEINTGVLKLVFDENDIYAYNSMLFDKVLYAGVKIYAVEYKDAGSQASAEVYYPLNQNLSELAALDPNLLDAVKQEMIIKREQVDQSLGGSVDTLNEKELAKLSSQIEKARQNIGKQFTSAQKEIAKRIEVERKAAEKANK